MFLRKSIENEISNIFKALFDLLKEFFLKKWVYLAPY